MKIEVTNNIKVAIVSDPDLLISEVQDAVDLLGEASFEGCNRIIVNETNLHPDFFRLHTGLAGEVLQKFSNYQCKLAIVGDFSKYTSKSLQDFIRESNRGNSLFFVDSLDTAIMKLTTM